MNSYIQRARVAASRPIRDSPEFRRIQALPRRLVPDVPEGWGDQFRAEQASLALRPSQAQALWELSQCGGLLGDMPVGSGKTLVALLAPVVLGAKRPLLLVPSSLIPKTKADIEYYGIHFNLPADLDVLSYEALSQAKMAQYLARLQPDLICGDEAHKISRSGSARSKVLNIYRRKNPHCKYVWLSGTLITRSIRDCAGLSNMALGSGSPYPRDYQTIDSWSWAVDDGVLFEAPPGVLEGFCAEGENAREGLRRRVRETRGVVGSAGSEQCAASLVFRTAPVKVPKEVVKALADLRTKWELPGDVELEDPLSQYRAVEQLSCGYFLRWTWPRGESPELQFTWRRARAAWNTAVYQKLKRATEGMTSPLLLYQAAAAGRWEEPSWEPWAQIRKECRPKTEAVWVSDYLIKAATTWAQKHHGIVWVDGPEFGARLAEASGLPYYGGGPESAAALAALERSAPGTPSIIVSINAHRDGLNLQGPYGEALYTCVPRVAKEWQQSIGRIHRPGQTRDEVEIYIIQHTPELKEALQDARRNADFIYQIQGADGLLRRGTWLITS